MANSSASIESAKVGAPWSDDELSSAVQAYMWMLRRELRNEPFVKSAVNQKLRSGPLALRTKSSIELRMQNISSTLFDMRMPRISGYVPAKNVGSGVKDRLRELLVEHGIAELSMYQATADLDVLETSVSNLRTATIPAVPLGTFRPQKLQTMTSIFYRDPAVKAWILQESGGFCEGCEAPAPFNGSDDLPFLEVHHVVPLSHSGSDTVLNAVALCPNCHRRCHFSNDRDEFKLALYERIPRLKIEIPEIEVSELGQFVGLE